MCCKKHTNFSDYFGITVNDLVDTLHTRMNQYNSNELKQSLKELCDEMDKKEYIPVFPL